MVVIEGAPVGRAISGYWKKARTWVPVFAGMTILDFEPDKEDNAWPIRIPKTAIKTRTPRK